MKRILITLCMAGAFLTSCHSDIITHLDSGVDVISKCCKEIAVVRTKGCKFIESSERVVEESSNSKGLLPNYSWDAKQMLW